MQAQKMMPTMTLVKQYYYKLRLCFAYGSVSFIKYIEYHNRYTKDTGRLRMPTKIGKLHKDGLPQKIVAKCGLSSVVFQIPPAYNKQCPLNSAELIISGINTNKLVSSASKYVVTCDKTRILPIPISYKAACFPWQEPNLGHPKPRDQYVYCPLLRKSGSEIKTCVAQFFC